jgi:hypothetical protein
MRRLLGLMAAVMLLANTGCLTNIYSGDPIVRTQQLMVESENLRTIQDEWRRIWFTDMPSHLNPQRVDGGLAP